MQEAFTSLVWLDEDAFGECGTSKLDAICRFQPGRMPPEICRCSAGMVSVRWISAASPRLAMHGATAPASASVAMYAVSTVCIRRLVAVTDMAAAGMGLTVFFNAAVRVAFKKLGADAVDLPWRRYIRQTMK